jgi:hypothetical protein
VWRWLHVRGYRRHFFERLPSPAQASMFHCNPWAHLRFDLDSGTFEERENPYATPASLYQLCDREHVYEAFSPDFVVQAFAAEEGAVDVDRALLRRAADALSIAADFSSPEATTTTGAAILLQCGLRASEVVFDKLKAYVAAENKRLLVQLSCPGQDVVDACRGRSRFDQRFVDYLEAHGFRYVDGLQSHLQDYRDFRCSPEEYVRRYYVGHYNPKGNHFFAFAVKNATVDWLDPKPPAYRPGGVSLQELAAALT